MGNLLLLLTLYQEYKLIVFGPVTKGPICEY